MTSTFFAAVSRMKYIERWALMRSARPENLSEHSLEVAMIAHGLCTIGNVRYGRHLNAERAALIGLYHDAAEIITGDMPTPVKYYNDDIRTAYKQIEGIAENRLLSRLPEDLRPAYEILFTPDGTEEDAYMRRLVKAADKLSALIKCIEEERSGNTEFRTAAESTKKALMEMAGEYPEVKDFMEEFLPAYGSTLDELK
ncbi:MAG: 5'-deoxynucleotidase [Lachnospiraceae bacterium]